MRLVVFHYHLLPGGVTQVISSSAIAVLNYLPEVEGITLVSGKKENTDNVAARIRTKLDSNISNKPDIIKSAIIPELDYISDMKKYPNPESLKKILHDNFAGYLWWVHNYHLGKNPFFTEALLQTAEEFPEQKIILQIHDFPEASRYNNLETLYKHITLPLYPVYPNIRYVTINSRDKAYLIDAGIPKEMVFLLNNPVEPLKMEEGYGYFNSFLQTKTHFDRLSTALSNRRKETGREKIDTVLSKSAPSYIKGAPLMVYPVRTIRRKNVLEAGLLAKCSITPVNLLPTLPGVSKLEIAYSKIVDNCFRDNLITGAARAGPILESEGITFPDIMNAGSIIISSSVQEGFGYLFINSLQWGKPLIARKLDILNDFSNIFHSRFSYFYDRVNIPLSTTLRKQMEQDYTKKISELSKFLDYNIILNLKKQKNQILQKSIIDFSYLSTNMQQNFLKSLKDKGLLDETRKINTTLLKEVEMKLSTKMDNFKESDIEKFNLKNHAVQIQNIISSLKHNPQIISPPRKNINYSLMTSFIDFPSISLLYDPV